MEIYSKVDSLPTGQASDVITPGCLVIEGGSLRGLYDSGVTDCLMVNGINLKYVCGISAGALAAFYYAAGNIGTSGRANLIYRHDKSWVSFKNILGKERGLFGFDYLFNVLNDVLPFNEERLLHGKQKVIVGATNCKTGRLTMFANTDPDFYSALRASASMPLVSKMVPIRDGLFLDGGCSRKVPLQWALQHNFEKIVVIRTREKEYRREVKPLSPALKAMYHRYPNLLKALDRVDQNYNDMCDLMERLEKDGRIFSIYPSRPVTIKKLEGDMEKLGDLYWQGYHDTEVKIPALKKYLA